MKRIISTFTALLLIVITSFAQSPEAFKYQAVVRDGGGQVMMNQAVSFRISILENNPSGTNVYSETHAATTNAFGLANLEIGNGTIVSGNFSTINWETDNYFVQIELDPNGGSSYQMLGTSQLLSVPYALHSKTADDVPGDNDQSATNEIQTLFLGGTSLSISGGNTIDLSPIQDGVNDADSDPANEIQNLGLAGTNLSISGGNTVDLSPIQDGVNDADSNPTNEIQSLGLAGTNLSISGGNTVDLSPIQDGVNDADSNPTNEIQTLALAGNTLSISGSNSVDLSTTGPDPIWLENGNDIYYDTGDIGVNTNDPEFDVHVDGELFVNSSAGRLNIGLPSNGNQWRFSTQGSGANLQLQSKPTGSFTYTRRVYFQGSTGNVAIGNNSNPDEELVVGSNLGSGWAIPAVTVGGTNGGVFQAGNVDYKISMENSSTFGRARIIVTSPTGFGRGEAEMRTNGLTIGENAGGPGAFMLKVEHGSFGVNFARASTTNDWEFLTSSAAASNLNLYANGAFRGSFSGTDGSWNPSSDRSLKTDIRQLDNVLPNLMKLKPSRYKYIDNNPKNSESIGFIAQEVKAYFPELVFVVEDERSKGMHALNYGGMSVLAIKAIQEQQVLIKSQAEQIEAQQEEIDDLKARITAIEAALSSGSK